MGEGVVSAVFAAGWEASSGAVLLTSVSLCMPLQGDLCSDGEIN